MSVSQASPLASASWSAWSGLATFTQLSLPLEMPSPSLSGGGREPEGTALAANAKTRIVVAPSAKAAKRPSAFLAEVGFLTSRGLAANGIGAFGVAKT